jgi:8-oxo-dGTP pyrophosphatase MutT (NUDIX family)
MDLDERLRRCLDPADAGWTPTALRRAAVLCPIVEHAGAAHVVFVVRPAELRQHGGQIAFPGGMRDGDETPLATALRECREEIGVPATATTVLGSLPPRESSSAILVHCLVGRLQPVDLVPDAREVERVLRIPLAQLLDAQHWQERTPPPTATGRQPRSSPHFEFGSDLVWGLTARFVRDLAARLTR